MTLHLNVWFSLRLSPGADQKASEVRRLAKVYDTL
jgi:hypothetical protein